MIDLRTIMKSALNAVFSLGPDFIKDGTYVRPASFNPQTGLTVSGEIAVAVKMFPGTYRPQELGLVSIQPGDEKILIRAFELAAITAPAAGDYLLQSSDGQRRDILSAILDRTAEFWIFQTQRSQHEDWGDLTASTTNEDWGDLATVTELDDWGTLV
jgi:hypothetical protein